ncbi:hypothetical protein Tco_0131507, partial [Tanacetum coccineum]
PSEGSQVLLLPVTNERDDVFMAETENHFQLIAELILSLVTCGEQTFDGNCAVLPTFKGLAFVNHTESTISYPSFLTFHSDGQVDVPQWNKQIFLFLILQALLCNSRRRTVVLRIESV